MLTFEVSITVSVGGVDIDRRLLVNMQAFLAERANAGKCSLERGGAAFHLHLQMVARLQSKTLIAISRLVKVYLGWDSAEPVGGMVMCMKLANKGLHTFIGLLGYCMKDACKEHFETVDHNVTASDISLGLEQYALHGQEENKNRVVLTMHNLVERVFMWRKFSCKHPLQVDFSRDIYEMLKTGRYYLAATWVTGTYGRGYEPYRMQSLYKILVFPRDISRQDVSNVFEARDNHDMVPRADWFAGHWQKEAVPSALPATPIALPLFLGIEEMQQAAALCCIKTSAMDIAQILVHTSTKGDSNEAGPSRLPIHPDATEDPERKRKGKCKVSPTNHLWPEEWKQDFLDGSSSSSEGLPGVGYTSILPLEYIPLYTLIDPPLVVL